MTSMKSWMLGAAMVAGGLGLAAMPAQAAEFGIYVHAGPAYVPPCPGPGYAWVDGYYANGYWVPGYWNYVSGPAVRGYAGWQRGQRDWDRGRGHDFDRHAERYRR